MPLRWISQPASAQSPVAPEEPIVVLAAPGTVVTPRHRLTQALAAGSLLAAAFRPMPGLRPRAAAASFNVTNLNGSGPGSLRLALDNANANPGPDTVTFQPGLVGTIPITTQLKISDSVQIVGPGPGALSISGGHTTRVFYLYTPTHNAFTTTISGLTIRDGLDVGVNGGGGIIDWGEPLTLDNVHVVSNTASAPTGRGGGVDIAINNTVHGGLTLWDTIVSGNHANAGGGIYLDATRNPVLIQNTLIVSNTATSAGGGVMFNITVGDTTIEDSTLTDNTSLDGGAIKFLDSKGGQHIIRRTTISGNNGNHGGGISLDNWSDPVSIEDSTISGNHATANAGGIYVSSSIQRLSIQNSTIVNNTALAAGGGVKIITGTVPLSNTIIAGNSATLNPDLDGHVILHYDLVQITGAAAITDAGGNNFGLDPLLGPLADNGGPTQTHLPAHNSPVVNAGDPAFAPPPATDQRGNPRVSGGRVDIGAVETQELFLPLVRR